MVSTKMVCSMSAFTLEYFTVVFGCVLGNLSVQVFPATSEEYQQWEDENRSWSERYERDIAKVQDTETLPSSVVEYAD